MRRVLWAMSVAVLVGGLGAVSGLAQNANKENIKFTTVDGVEIRGAYYQGKVKGPTILLLHAIGEDSHKAGWTFLADKLNEAGFNVITFDFRGHGDSKAVDPEKFWTFTHNKLYVKPGKGDSIEEKNFNKATYLPALINDIAAAKAYLDRAKNDQGLCNSGNLILVGAETGATLGAGWLNSEWARYKMILQPMTFISTPATNPEGKDIISCIWLSISPKLGSRTVNIGGTLEVAAKLKATPMVFFASEEDGESKNLATKTETFIKGTNKVKYPYTTSVIVPKSKLKGSALLQKSLALDTAILDYLKDVVEAKGNNEWTEKEFRKSNYIWKVGSQAMKAKVGESDTLVYETYNGFFR